MTTSIPQALADSELLRMLDDSARAPLIEQLEQIRLPGGQTLFRQGDIGDCLYLLTSGRLRVTIRRDGGAEEVVGEIRRGETVGEMALLSGEPRSATVSAVRDSELYRLSAEAFGRLMERHPRVAMELSRRIVRRYLAAVHSAPSVARSSAFALVPARWETPLSEVSHDLEDALTEFGSVRRLNSDVVDEALGPDASQVPPDHARDAEVLAWLDHQESKHDFVIYEADLVPSAWSRRCVRQSDRILVVADAEEPADPAQFEASLYSGPDAPAVRRELLLVHREARPIYPRTSEWLAPRQVSALYHVARGVRDDYDRLARFVTGRATGVVLGGGGTRCFAHIGVLRALDEAGVLVDAIGGTSMGAYIAAQYALGWDHERMRAYNRDMWVRVKPMRDYTLPRLSLIRGRGFRRVARDIAGSAMIEDLATRFFCVSSNLTRATVRVHHRGPLDRSILASISVPGLLPPVSEGGDLLVDGAILDNVPVDVMRASCEGTVIACDVSPLVDLAIDPADSLPEPGWALATPPGRSPRGARKRPSVVDILSRVSTLNSTIAVEALRRQANLYLHPPTEAYTVVDWKRAEGLIDAGYAYAVEAINEWLANGKAEPLRGPPRRRVSRTPLRKGEGSP